MPVHISRSKPREERDASAQQIIARLRPQLDKVEGAKLFMQAAQDVRVGGRSSRTEFQYTLQDPDFDELNVWAPKLLAKLQPLPELRDVATDQQSAGTTLTLTINRDQASRYGISAQLIDDTLYDAFGQRQIAQYFTQVNSYHVVMEILPQQQGQVDSLNKIFIKSPVTGGRGAALGHYGLDDDAGTAALDQSPGAVPRRDDLLQPGAGKSAQRCHDRHFPGAGRAGHADHDPDLLPG